jgi:hypothetical protein
MVRLRLEPPSERTRPPSKASKSIIASLKRVLFGLMVFTVLTSLLLQAILKTGGPGKVVVALQRAHFLKKTSRHSAAHIQKV